MTPLASPTAPDLELGAAVATALLREADWKHRKVESLRLLEGDFGRRRVSIDCTPPSALNIEFPEKSRLVPLAFLEKKPLRQLDVTDGEGRSLSVLGRGDDGYLGYCALAAAITEDCGSCSDGLLHELSRLVFGDMEAAQVTWDLLETNYFPGLRLKGLSSTTEELVARFKTDFMLVVAVPQEAADRRQVFKYSYHWTIDYFPTKSDRSRARLRDWSLSWFDRFAVAFGYRAAKLEIPSFGVTDAHSYHLEVQAPIELICVGLTLPDHRSVEPHAADSEATVVAHAVGSYEAVGDSATSMLEVAVPKRGARMSAWLVTTFAATVFILEETLHGARIALLDGAEGAGALLIVVPAALFAFVARPQENALSSQILLPLRMVVLLCSALLLLCAGSLVGALHEPWISWLWLSSAVVTGALSVIQAVSLRFVRI